ncbi:ras-domain-containing protein [Testicularia cyperi]|uniref:Ras-domain-containing protein n=1 Tax=Testicularia cyperi TaxID=1882483 RepID=A0A317XPH9_9BASI|nr:ras-domain-containing protein [Testicularia cyperi]
MAPIRIPSGSYSQTTGGASTAPTASGWDYILKFILIGDSSVGKSSLLVRLTDDRFLADPDPTIGVEFGSHLIQLDNGETVKVQVWDTAGSESFRSITRSYYRGAAGALLVYDITHRASFLNAKTWLDDVRSHAEERVTVVLVGNMNDLVASDDDAAAASNTPSSDQRQRLERRRSKGKKREVSYEEAAEFARKEGLLFLETSAKTGHNVQEAFAQAARDIHSKFSAAEAGSADYDNSTLAKRSRTRARAGGRTSGTIAIDQPSASAISVRGISESDEPDPNAPPHTATDAGKQCCVIA